MGSCLIAGAMTLALASPGFTLSWTHSVEKITWRESWAITGTGLRLTEAAVKGSGAGMEPGDGAVLRNGWCAGANQGDAAPGGTKNEHSSSFAGSGERKGYFLKSLIASRPNCMISSPISRACVIARAPCCLR